MPQRLRVPRELDLDSALSGSTAAALGPALDSGMDDPSAAMQLVQQAPATAAPALDSVGDILQRLGGGPTDAGAVAQRDGTAPEQTDDGAGSSSRVAAGSGAMATRPTGDRDAASVAAGSSDGTPRQLSAAADPASAGMTEAAGAPDSACGGVSESAATTDRASTSVSESAGGADQASAGVNESAAAADRAPATADQAGAQGAGADAASPASALGSAGGAAAAAPTGGGASFPAAAAASAAAPAASSATATAGPGAVNSSAAAPVAASATQTDAGANLATADSGSGAANLATGDLALIDLELAEHERWAGAQARVGAAGSTDRAAFVAESVGSGLLGGFAQGAAEGVKWGLIGKAAAEFSGIPGIGAVVGGYQALDALSSKSLDHAAEVVSKFGEGSDTYEELANSIAAIAQIVDTTVNIMNVIAGIAEVVSVALWVVAGAGVLLAIVTFGAGAGVAAMAAEAAGTLDEVATAITEVSFVLAKISGFILQPCVALFRSLHAFTSDADPSQVEAQGAEISEAARASGGLLGGMAGGEMLEGATSEHPQENEPPNPEATKPPEEPTPPAADPPTVQYEEPNAALAAPDSASSPPPVDTLEPQGGATGATDAPIQHAAVDVPEGPGVRSASDEIVSGNDVSSGPDSQATDIPPEHQKTLEVLQEFADLSLTPEERQADLLAQHDVHTTTSDNPPGAVAEPEAMQAGKFVDKYGRDPSVGPGGQGPLIPAEQLPPGGKSQVSIPVEGGTIRPDLVFDQEGVVSDTKPSHSADQSQAESDYYASVMNEETPLGDGREWEGRPSTYDQQTTIDYMRDIGYLPPKNGSESSGGAGGGTSGAPPAAPALVGPVQPEGPVGGGRPPASGVQAPEQLTLPGVQDAPAPPQPVNPELPGAQGVDPDLVGRAARSETQQGLERNKAAIADQLRANGAPQSQIDQVLTQVDQLNAQQRAQRAQATAGTSAQVQPDVVLPIEYPSASVGPTDEGFATRHRLQEPRGGGQISEHVIPGAQWEAISAPSPADPAHKIYESQTGRHYQNDTTVRVDADVAEFKTHQGAQSDNRRTDAIKNRAASGGGVNVIDDLYLPSIDQTRAAIAATPGSNVTEGQAVYGATAQLQHQFDVGAGDISYRASRQLRDRGAETGQVGDLARNLDPHGVAPFSEAGWDATFGLQPTAPGSQLILPGMQNVAPRPSGGTAPSEQMWLPGLSPQQVGDPRQLSLDFSGAGRGGPGSTPAGPQGAGGSTPGGSTRSGTTPGGTTEGGPAPGSTTQSGPTPGGTAEGGPAHVHAHLHTDAEQKPGAGVETVNPNYPPPPGTPQQVKQMEAEIENLLAARAAAEQSEARMTAEEQQHRQNQEHAQHAVQSTDQAISATAAHQQVVAKRQATNQQQQQRQQESQGLVAGYPSQATGLAALTGPLTVFQGFTHLASALPGSAGDSMQKMADDSDRLMAAFGQMGSGMESQNAAQPARQQELQGDQQRLESTDQQAQASDDQLQQAKQGAETFRQTNAAKLEQATQARAEASDQKQELEEAATTKQTQAETLSQQMQEWAAGHKAARDAAIEETKQRLQTEGKIVTGTSQGT